jgi:hypothetical protein
VSAASPLDRWPARAERLRDLIVEVGPLEAENVDALSGTTLVEDRFVLVQRYRMPDRVWLTLHPSARGAADYALSDEDPAWWTDRLVDLETGAVFDARHVIKWTARQEPS